MKNQIKLLVPVLILVISAAMTSCKKDAHTPPSVAFKTTSGYTYKDTAVGKNVTLTVGITGTKTEDEMKTFDVSYAYDGASTTTDLSGYPYSMTKAEYDNFSKDVTITTRNVAGTEKWNFTVTDKDGNVTTQSFTLTVN